MTATTAKRRPKLRLIQPTRGPDVAALEKVLTEVAQQTMPMVKPSTVLRQRLEADLKAKMEELAAVENNEALVDRVYATAKASFEDVKDDLRLEITMLRNGLLDGAEATEGQTA